MGIASEKYFAMEHRYPSRAKWLDKFGYDPKQLHHLLRVSEYLDRYLSGESYQSCLLTKQPEYLKNIKRGLLDLETARYIADKTYKDIKLKCDLFIKGHQDDPIDEKVNKLLDEICCEIMEKSIRRDFNENA